MIGDFRDPSAMVAYRVGVTPAQLRFMKRASAKSGVWTYRTRTAAILETRDLIGKISSSWHLTTAGEELLRKAERIALMAVLEW
jgi:hypothetical protein